MIKNKRKIELWTLLDLIEQSIPNNQMVNQFYATKDRTKREIEQFISNIRIRMCATNRNPEYMNSADGKKTKAFITIDDSLFEKEDDK